MFCFGLLGVPRSSQRCRVKKQKCQIGDDDRDQTSRIRFMCFKKSKLCLFLCGRLSGIMVPYCPPVFTTHDHIVLGVSSLFAVLRLSEHFLFFSVVLFWFFFCTAHHKAPFENSLNTDTLPDSFSDAKLHSMAFVFHTSATCVIT